MMPISLFIAWRYLIRTRDEKSISIMIKICFFSISLGTFGLALIVSIMNGFEFITHEKIQNIHPQIILQAQKNFLNIEQISRVLKKEFPQVEHFSPSNTQYAIIDTKDVSQDINNVIVVKGIDPINEPSINNFTKKITFILGRDKNLTSLLRDNSVIIGQKLAKTLNIKIGDSLSVLIPRENQISKITFDKADIFVTGLFDTGIDDFDNKLIICSLEYLLNIFPNTGITQIGIKLKKDANEKEVISNLKKRFKLDVFSWKDLYPSLVSALKLEKYVMFFILALVTLIAGMNIISLIYMLIMEKQSDIAILKSMGFNNKELKIIFFIIGTTISIISGIFGLLTAYICGLILDRYPFIELPDAYYVSQLPIKMDLSIFIQVFITVVFIGTVATLIPTRKIFSINVSKTLKTER